jgi:thioredoxin
MNRLPEVADGKKAVCGRCKSELPSSGERTPVVATDASFATLIGTNDRVIVDFWAAWCGPCRTIAPVIEGLARERSDLTVAKLNVDENGRTASEFRVTGIPTLVFFANGREAGRLVGAVGRPQIDAAIRQYFGGANG